MDDDMTDAAWAHQECDERHRREDEALERARQLSERFRRDRADYERETREFWERLRRVACRK